MPQEGCFSDTTTVQVYQRGPVQMKDLQVGDWVLTGKDTYQPVYTFGHHRNETTEKMFYQIYHHNSKREEPIEMTGNHLIFVLDTSSGKAKPIRVDQLQEFDHLITVGHATSSENEDTPTTVQVSRFALTRKRGVFMPLTASGKIIVHEGIVASNYVSLQEETPSIVESALLFPFVDEHTLSHWFLSPYRIACGVHFIDVCGGHSHDEEGILRWLTLGRRMARAAEHYESFASVPTFLFFGLCNILEIVFLGPLVWATFGMELVLLSVVVYGFHQYNEV
ncbi:expressed unknown protein [Seminavis robusta]|uniref:Hint domain-containing protein n=1 Tax=Seminavis robusta TaxID=568900 RepID=A0A9N8F4K2_9STRA|nr:expressed unknown protein [Seminavis robusta]|eukprot:Sro2986_g341680.1 n/a (279) ;mRNA; r:8863-9827